MKTYFLLLALGCFAAAFAAEPPAMTTTASGLEYVITARGNGPAPKTGQVVLARYVGTLSDGTVFDRSRPDAPPFAFTIGKGHVIKGWDEGFALLRVGDRARFVIPPTLAYGERQRGPIPPNSTLHFEVEFLDLKERAASEMLLEVIDSAGLEAAQRRFAELKAANFADAFMDEGQLNAVGHRYLRRDRLPEAIAVFRWAEELYPHSARVYSSLGDALLKNGQREPARQSYEKALALDPKNTNAAKALAELKAPAAKAP